MAEQAMNDDGLCLVIHLRETGPLFESRRLDQEYGLGTAKLFDGSYSAADEVTTFYDWLRTSTGRIVGVRLCDVEPWFLDEMARFAYCGVDGPPVIFFASERAYEEELSGDQDFGFTRAWKSSGGDHLACSLEMSSQELRHLSHLRFERVDATS